jgi:hypothetical protein
MEDRSALMQSIGHRFIDAFNRRDAEGLVELCDPQVDFRPTALVGDRLVYRGHDGLRRWVSELDQALVQHQVRVREVREIDPDRLLVVSEVRVDGELLSPSAMVATIDEDGMIVQARAYLSDEQLLIDLGLVGNPAVDRSHPGQAE